ncbi:hypothetical protein K474DRAFT_1674104 [Panus rudis PR-1116 ss-1]|nr:hypothetical protein K474DRAFT_1674104 [Panus rudis PR-1116 ss-1]
MNVLCGAFLVDNWFAGVRFLHNLPVKFAIQHFFMSHRFDRDVSLPPLVDYYGDPSDPNIPPEARRQDPQPFDPFAADVYRLGSVFLSYFSRIVQDLPKLGPILERMTRVDPRERITMGEAATLVEDIMYADVYRPTPFGKMLPLFSVATAIQTEEEDMDEFDLSESESEGKD